MAKINREAYSSKGFELVDYKKIWMYSLFNQVCMSLKWV